MSYAEQQPVPKPPSKAEISKLLERQLETWLRRQGAKKASSKSKPTSWQLKAALDAAKRQSLKKSGTSKSRAALNAAAFAKWKASRQLAAASKSKAALNKAAFAKWKLGLKNSASKSKGGRKSSGTSKSKAALKSAFKLGKGLAAGEIAAAKADVKLVADFAKKPSPKLALKIGKRLFERKFSKALAVKKFALGRLGPARVDKIKRVASKHLGSASRKLASGGRKFASGARKFARKFGLKDSAAAAPESTGHGGLVAGACVFTVVACAVVGLFLRARRQSQKAAPDQYETLA